MRKILMFIAITIISIGCKAQTTDKADNQNGGKTIELTKKEFMKKVSTYNLGSKEWKYLGDKPAIVDFYASWCGPCKQIAPILNDLAKEYNGKIYIYKVNTETEKDLASAYGIKSIPTLLFIPMKGTPTMVKGALSKDEFVKEIKNILPAKDKETAKSVK